MAASGSDREDHYGVPSQDIWRTDRVIPINSELARILAAHLAWFVDRFGPPQPDHHLFPWGSSDPVDPTRHVVTVKRASGTLRNRTGVRCRLHDLRHAFATGLAEWGVSESAMLALIGHMSRSMLERYSHIRMAAKVAAVEGLSLYRSRLIRRQSLH